MKSERIVRRLKISSRLLLFYFILSLFPIVAIGIFNYVSSTDILKDRVSQYGLQASYTVQRNVNIRIEKMDDHMIDLVYSKGIQTLYDQFYNRPDSAEFVNIQIQNELKENYNIKELQILALRLQLKDPETGELLNSYQIDPQNLFSEEILSVDDLDLIEESFGRAVWKPVELTSGFSHVATKGTTDRGYLISRTVSRISTGKKIGVVSLFVSSDYLKESVDTLNEDGTLSLVNRDGLLTYSTDASLMDERFAESVIGKDELQSGTNTLGTREFEGVESMIFSSGPADNEWYTLYTFPYELLVYRTRRVAITTFVIAGILLFITAVTARLLSSSITSPLKRLSAVSKQVQKGDFKQSVQPVGDDEITELTIAYNTMISEVGHLIDEVYKSELKEKEARLQALRAKINPHFLFNTLDTIRWTARKNQPEVTSEQIERLSSLFRTVLESSGPLWTIEQEIEYVKSYLYFQEIRYAGRVHFSWSVDEELTSSYIPVLILQPLVENVIVHGLPEDGRPVEAVITLERLDENHMSLTVSDDGRGCDLGHTEGIDTDGYDTHHIALKNIGERIALRYGSEGSVETESSPGNGYRITITFPMKARNER